MACIRWIAIENFRGIKKLSWQLGPGINCLIGPGDSSKTTVLDAIDLCLGARRNVPFLDTDFYRMDTTSAIGIHIIMGDLPDELLSINSYGVFLKGYDNSKHELYDEPKAQLEPVLQISLVVESDLEPSWTIHSQRSAAEGIVRQLAWKEKVMLAPTRIGTNSDFNLSWKRGSILNRLTEERTDAAAALIQAGRDARNAFGTQANEQLQDALNIVTSTANELGVDVGENAQALIDSHSISFGSGTVALHNSEGVRGKVPRCLLHHDRNPGIPARVVFQWNRITPTSSPIENISKRRRDKGQGRLSFKRQTNSGKGRRQHVAIERTGS